MDIEAAKRHLQFASPEMRQVLIAQSAAELIRESIGDILKLAADVGVPTVVVVAELLAAAGALSNETTVEAERERIRAALAGALREGSQAQN